jgi:hypothetical protein
VPARLHRLLQRLLGHSGLVVRCSPNPCDRHEYPGWAPSDDAPYLWVYRTEVENTLAVPLTVTRFEASSLVDGRWTPGNVLGRALTGEDFSDWYRAGALIVGGVVPAGATAADDRNWHRARSPEGRPCKWEYWAVAPDGREHHAEVVVRCVPYPKSPRSTD